jgi:hypothetical protein
MSESPVGPGNDMQRDQERSSKECIASTSYNYAGGVPLEDVSNVGCSGSEPAGEVKRMVGKPFTFKMVALVCLVYLV